MDIDSLLQEAEKEFKDFLKENPIVPVKNILPFKLGYIRGYEKASKTMYSEEEVLNLLLKSEEFTSSYNSRTDLTVWFEQFKKK